VPVWDAEREVDQQLARALIDEQFPRLDTSELRLLGQGWDNTVWLTRDGVAFRFPRRAIAVPGIEREIALLPLLARRLAVQVPDAAYPGRPTEAYGWPWFGSRLIDGDELAEADELPPPASTTLVHGDLHARHVLVARDGRHARATGAPALEREMIAGLERTLIV
jgi:aminoglycoside phosphotransferase (APT) family kinase protein